METPDFRLYWWIKNNSRSARYNLSSSGLAEPNLEEMGVSTDYEEFRASGVDPEEEFRKAVGELYGVSPENVVPTVGGTEAIYLVCRLMAKRLEKFFVPKPNYEPMINLPYMFGLKNVSSPFDGPTLICLTDSNNPTGRSLERGWVERLIAESHEGLRIFVDEAFREFGFSETPETWFKRGGGRVVSSNTLTKFYGLGGLRVGWIIACEEVVEELSRLKAYTTGENPSYSLWIAAQVLRKRSKFVERAKRIVSRNRKRVEEFLEATPGLSWSNPDAAPFCLVGYAWDVSSERLCRDALREAGVLVAPAEFFGAQAGFRLCFTESDEGRLVEGLGALSRFLGGRFR